jgi:hypothetical protein
MTVIPPVFYTVLNTSTIDVIYKLQRPLTKALILPVRAVNALELLLKSTALMENVLRDALASQAMPKPPS